MSITASLVKELRDKTNAGMMDCKKALSETGGDLDSAVKWLREKGIAKAAKKAGREAKEGVIAAQIADSGQSGILVEINCETDFVAKNENFQTFVSELTEAVLASEASTLDEAFAIPVANGTLEEWVQTKVLELGENLQFRRLERFQAQGNGRVASYIHLGGKVGVLLEVACEKAETASQEAFQNLLKDLTLHIAATAPSGLSRDDIPQELVEAEKDVFRKQMEESGKPAEIIEKIIVGKLGKFYSEHVLLEQAFVKNPDSSVKDLVAEQGKALGDQLTIVRFSRFAVGE